MGNLIVDADILIDILRGHPDATAFVAAHAASIVLSVITVTEIYAGIRNRKEAQHVEMLCAMFKKIPMDEAIAIQAGRYRNSSGKSHGSGLGDCVLAATATCEGLTLVTLNKKHYPMLTDVLIPYKKH